MTRFVAFEDTEFQRVAAPGYSFDSYVFFGSRKYSGPGPQVYMNSVDPGVTLSAHFHRIDQFQVFFGTDGARFQRKPVPPVFVHYADAFATYGPFSAAPDASLLYATIRARSDNYGGVMPGARGERPYLGRRHLSAGVDGWDAVQPAACGRSRDGRDLPPRRRRSRRQSGAPGARRGLERARRERHFGPGAVHCGWRGGSRRGVLWPSLDRLAGPHRLPAARAGRRDRLCLAHAGLPLARHSPGERQAQVDRQHDARDVASLL